MAPKKWCYDGFVEIMDDFIEKLNTQETQSIIKVMAFMSYNSSIGRVLASGGVDDFQEMAIRKVKKLEKITSIKSFDNFHNIWVQEIINTIKLNKKNKGKSCSYGQAQKPINVFLKLYVDWAKLPRPKIANILLPFLHVPLDSILMKNIKKEYKNFYKKNLSLTARYFQLVKDYKRDIF